MTINDIKKIIANDETRQVELKKTTGELKDAMHSACAFLNTDGGWLIFGIAPKEPHGSYPYNPLIAEVLYKTSYLESWGSGVKRIIDACRKQNVQDPEWSMSGGFVTVTFRKSIKSDNLTNNPTNVGESDSKITGRVIENREKVIEKVIEKASMLGERVTENKIKILRLILETPTISKAEISKLIGISENSVSRNIEAMRNKYIRRVGSDRGGYWEVIV